MRIAGNTETAERALRSSTAGGPPPRNDAM
jgi:hypothetical protein